MTRPEFSLHHGGLSVSNLERSMEFYRRVFGFELDTKVTSSDGSLVIVHLKRGNDYLELFCHQSPKPMPEHAHDPMSDFAVIGTKHIAFATYQAEQMHAFLRKQKVEGLTGIYENNPHYLYFFLKDPDGIIIEIVSPKH